MMFFCLWGILCFHSCIPGSSQRDVLSLQRASDDVIRDYTDSFRMSGFFQAATKNCPHCGKLVEANVSVGECMFREAADLPPDTPGFAEKVSAMRRQLRGEAEMGCGTANLILGLIKENGLFGTKPDLIGAARHYRLYADTGDASGRIALAAFWVRIGENLPGAAELLKKASEEEPRNTECLMYLSRACTMMGKHLEAFEAAKKAYYYSPVNSLERAGIEVSFVSCLLAAAGEIGEESALAQINDLIFISPKNDRLKFARAAVYAQFGQFDQAMKQLDDIKDTVPERILAVERVRIEALKGDFAAANKRLDALLAERKTDPELRRLKVELLLREKKEKEAFDMVGAWIGSDENKCDACLIRAQMYLNKKEYDAAVRDCEEARKYASPAEQVYIDRIIENIRTVQADPLQMNLFPQMEFPAGQR